MAAKSNEIEIIRMYDAPLKMVWEAWMDPKQKAKWWGPRGFTITTHHSDIRTGGTWDYTMHGPDGTDWENVTKYLEVEKYQRLVYDHGGGKDRPPLFRVTVTFEEIKGKTKMHMIMALADAEAAKQTKKHIKDANGNSTWDRLAEYLQDDKPFFINRTFEADQKTLFEMFSEPKHLTRWLAPRGFQMKSQTAKIKEGEEMFYSMGDAEGKNMMYGKIHYQKISPYDRMVYTQIFTDENGKVSRHPFAPTWPETMLTEVTFTPESPTETRVTIRWEVYGPATALEHETFQNGKAGMTQGWTGSFDKLEEYLRKS